MESDFPNRSLETPSWKRKLVVLQQDSSIDYLWVDFVPIHMHGGSNCQGANPMSTILAATFLSMEVCHEKKRGTLRCCNHLLYVWIVTHLYESNYMGYALDPLRRFHRIPMKKQQPTEWKKELSNYEVDHFSWVCPWYLPKHIIFNCGEFSNVSLVGLRGCVTYIPTKVIKLENLCKFMRVP